MRVFARLKQGVALEQARSEMAAIAARLRETHAYHRRVGLEIDVRPLVDDVVEHVRPVLLALAGAVGFVLLIACANVASLMLARTVARQQEGAVRAALGAGRWPLVRQALTEGVLLSVLGAGLGLVLARWGVLGLLALGPPDVPRLDEVSIDGSALLFTLGAGILSALLFSLAPAFAALRSDPARALHERRGASARLHLHAVLMVAEVALALVLLVCAGLTLQSFRNLTRVDPGFEPQGVLTYKVALPRRQYGTLEERSGFYRQMQDGLAARPGVAAVGSIFPAPLGGRFWTGPHGREDEPPAAWAEQEANFRSITPGYFAALGARLLAGRPLSWHDVEDERRVAVVDEVLARRLWPEEALHDVVGRRFGLDVLGARESLEVVGVVAHVRHADLSRDGTETVYFPFHLASRFPMTVMVRAAGEPEDLAAAARQIVIGLDPERPIYALQTMSAAVGEAIAPQCFAWLLIAVFAGVAVLLAAVGVHGVLSYAVGQRTPEIGVRMALGAGRSAILRQVVGRSLALTGVGVALGLVASAAASRVLGSLLLGIRPTDPVTYAVLAAALTLVALIASSLPAWRASHVDPMATLRTE